MLPIHKRDGVDIAQMETLAESALPYCCKHQSGNTRHPQSRTSCVITILRGAEDVRNQANKTVHHAQRKQSRSFDGSRFFSARSPSEIESLQMKRDNCDLDLQLRTRAHIKIPALLALEVILFSQDVFTTKHQRIISYRKTAQRHRHIQHRFTACWLHLPRASRQRA